MARKIIIASSGLVFVVCIGLIVFTFSAAALTIDPAQIESARQNVITLIESGRYKSAQEQLDLLVADFNEEPGLAQVLFAAGERFYWARRYAETKDTFGLLKKRFSCSTFAQQAGLWLARVDACTLIQQGKDAEAIETIDKMMTDYAGDAGLAEAAYWISKEFEWAKGNAEDRATRYEIPTALYQRISRQFAGSPRAAEAELDHKRLTHRTKIFTLMGDGDQNAVDNAIEVMEADFKDRPDIILEQLYWTGREYELYPDGINRAKFFYERIAVEFPNIPDEADAATKDAVRAAIEIEQRTNKKGEVQETIARLQHRLQGTPRLAPALYWMGLAYQEWAGKLQTSQSSDTTEYLDKAIELYRETRGLTSDSALTAATYYAEGDCYTALGQYRLAIQSYKTAVELQPDYKNACICHLRIAACYEKLVQFDKVSRSEGREQIIGACNTIITNYPGCSVSAEARKMLVRWEN